MTICITVHPKTKNLRHCGKSTQRSSNGIHGCSLKWSYFADQFLKICSRDLDNSENHPRYMYKDYKTGKKLAVGIIVSEQLVKPIAKHDAFGEIRTRVPRPLMGLPPHFLQFYVQLDLSKHKSKNSVSHCPVVKSLVYSVWTNSTYSVVWFLRKSVSSADITTKPHPSPHAP